jgi:hypothetical protein
MCDVLQPGQVLGNVDHGFAAHWIQLGLLALIQAHLDWQAIVDGSLPPRRKKRSTQVHLQQYDRYEQCEEGGCFCNLCSHVRRQYNVRADWLVSA